MLRTAESVSPKHPDKMCDQISDAILDSYLKQDPESRVAVEVLGGHGQMKIIGEVTTNAVVRMDDIEQIVYRITGGQVDDCSIKIVEQSREIGEGVDKGGAGDQGIMVGYACADTEEHMPLEVMLARDLCKRLYAKYGTDGKTQVTIETETHQIETVVASFQGTHTPTLRSDVNDWLLELKKATSGLGAVTAVWMATNVFANPAGHWNVGGFEADTGLTGRKLAVDAYGPSVPIGGGAFSGKDATKVDRSGAYMARKIAVDILRKLNYTAAQEQNRWPYFPVKEVYVHLAYAIGEPNPVQAIAIIDGKPTEIDAEYEYDLTPRGIIDFLELNKPQYEETAQWGHFGNGFPWDK